MKWTWGSWNVSCYKLTLLVWASPSALGQTKDANRQASEKESDLLALLWGSTYSSLEGFQFSYVEGTFGIWCYKMSFLNIGFETTVWYKQNIYFLSCDKCICWLLGLKTHCMIELEFIIQVCIEFINILCMHVCCILDEHYTPFSSARSAFRELILNPTCMFLFYFCIQFAACIFDASFLYCGMQGKHNGARVPSLYECFWNF